MIGRDLTIDDMLERGFDAVFIGSGTAVPKSLEIPGANLVGVVQSSYFLRTVSLYNDKSIGKNEICVKKGDHVAIIGAGNVAMDAARTAVRLGAEKVTVIYHKTVDEISALKTEYNEAVEEGVNFSWNTSVKELYGHKNKLKGAKLSINNNEVDVEIDTILLAIGSRPANRIVSTTSGIEVSDTGYVITKERPYGMTTRKGIFAGGDVVHTPQNCGAGHARSKKCCQRNSTIH